jgi:hypothetical protein
MSDRRGRRASKRGPQHDVPDLFADVRAALADPDPLRLLTLVSAVMAVLDPRNDHPLAPTDEGRPTVEELSATFVEVATPETTALLTVIGTLTSDEVLSTRIRRELASRPAPPADWLTQLTDTSTQRAVRMGHVLNDGDNIMLGVRLASDYELTIVVYIDHNLGTLVKDGFVLSEPMAGILAQYGQMADDPDVVWAELSPADARAWIEPAIERAAITFPPLKSESWPACRPLVEWITRTLPAGGSGYARPQRDSRQRDNLKERFFISRWGAPLDDADHRDLLESLLWYGTDYGPGDPLRWSAVRVEILFLDWLPRKVLAPAEYLAKAPDLLRAFVRFAHAEAGLRASLTDDALAAIDDCAPHYLSAIGSERPPHPADGLIGPQDLQYMLLDYFAQFVGGHEQLGQLDVRPLPDEPFQWAGIPDDIAGRVSEVLALVDACCDEFLDVEYRTVCRRLLARIVTGDPVVFRRNGRLETAAAAVIWIAGKANGLFESGSARIRLRATDLADHFGIGKNSAYQRAKPLLRAGGFSDDTYAVQLHSPEFLVSGQRAEICAERDRVLAGLGR